MNAPVPKDKTILIVEDDDSLREFFEMMLQREGFQVRSAASGEEALKTAEETPPDLIVLDFMLPGKGGFEVLKELQTGDTASVPIVVATARKLDAKMIAQIRSEPNVREYVTKPVNHAIFINSIHKVLGTKPGQGINPDDTLGFGRRKGW